MMVYSVLNFRFIYVILVILSSYTFAPWTARHPPPRDGRILACEEWIEYHGFERNHHRNRFLANTRAIIFDIDVSLWAAVYAYVVTNSSRLYDSDIFGPQQFCNLHVMSWTKFPFMSLKDAEFTCEGWIDLYLYDVKRDWSNLNYYSTNINTVENNFIWARGRDREMDDKISIWAAGFFKYITSGTDTALETTPAQYCQSMSQQIFDGRLPRKLPFITIDEVISYKFCDNSKIQRNSIVWMVLLLFYRSKMSCHEWELLRTYPYFRDHILMEERPAVKKLAFMSITGTTMSCEKWLELYGFSSVENGGNPETEIKNCFRRVILEMIDDINISSWVKYYIIHLDNWFSSNHEGRLMTPREYCVSIHKPHTLAVGFLDNANAN